MRPFELSDDFGRRTTFTGTKLAGESTDTASGSKPQWQDVDVYRTQAGKYVVSRTTHYRIRHTSDRCSRAEGYELIDATVLDTYPCASCNTARSMEGGVAQADRINVIAYDTPAELIKSFEADGKYSNLARTILADVSEQDDAVDAAWNTVVVP